MRSTLGFLAVLALWIATSQPLAAHPEQDYLTSNIDPTVSPRDDFFQYANGSWLKRNPIPDYAARWGIWNVNSDVVYSQLRRISEEAAAKKAPRGSDEQLVGDFWFAGMDATTINKKGLRPLQSDLDRTGRIRTTQDIIDLVAILHKGLLLIDSWNQPSVLFDARIGQDDLSSDRRILSLSQGGLSLGSRAYTGTQPQQVKIRKALQEYLYKTFLRLHRDAAKAQKSADAVFDLEAQLAAAFYEDDGYQKIGLVELEQLAPSIDWNRYFRLTGVHRIETVNMRKPRFFKSLDLLLSKIPIETWKDYLRFSLIKMYAPFLDDATFGDFFTYNSIFTGQREPRPRWKRVIWQEKYSLGQPLVRLYVKEYFRADRKARLQAAAESIRSAFRQRIEQLDWMSEDTKKSALLKLARLKITIGFPEKWTDFSTMQLGRDSFALNMRRAAEWFHDWKFKRLGEPIDRTELGLTPDLSGDAEYDDRNNEVRLGPASSSMVTRELSNDDFEDAFIYGSTALGHEISHAFDSEGRHYDANGNKADWWTPADNAAFLERAQLLIDEYNEFMPIEGRYVDGRNSLRENMADFVGLRIALDAFKQSEQFKKNEKFGGFTPLQRFFLAYAYSHMGHERTESIAARLGGGYAPDRERVNGVVVNIPEFYEAFGVKPGDRMYRPENKRARIW